MTQPDEIDWLAEERARYRRRHGRLPSEDEIHAAYDTALDAVLEAKRLAEEDKD